MSILEVKNLCKSFGKTQVLKGVNFSMEEGEVLSVIGPSGGGKTTILRCINFLETASKGEIFVNGECIFDADSKAKLKSADIRKRQLNFGLVFQSFNLFPQYTALENVMLAPKMSARELPNYKSSKDTILKKIEDDAKALLDQVGLSDKLNNYPCEL